MIYSMDIDFDFRVFLLAGFSVVLMMRIVFSGLLLILNHILLLFLYLFLVFNHINLRLLLFQISFPFVYLITFIILHISLNSFFIIIYWILIHLLLFLVLNGPLVLKLSQLFNVLPENFIVKMCPQFFYVLVHLFEMSLNDSPYCPELETSLNHHMRFL